MDKARLEAYISKENKGKLKMFSFEKQMTLSKTLDEILTAFFEEGAKYLLNKEYGGIKDVQIDKTGD